MKYSQPEETGCLAYNAGTSLCVILTDAFATLTIRKMIIVVVAGTISVIVRCCATAEQGQ